MLTTIFKFLFIYFFCIYICEKSSIICKWSYIRTLLLSLSLGVITYIISLHSKDLSYLLPLLLLWILTSIQNSCPKTSFVAITISFVISFIVYAIFSFIIALLIVPFFEASIHFPILAIATGILQAIAIKKTLAVKRFKNGIPFLSTSTQLNVTNFLCLAFIGFIIYMTSYYEAPSYRKFALFLFVLAFTFLINWWQSQITKAYRRSLELRELESLRTEVAELNLLVDRLMKENEKLARITHRDNTLISTLKNSTVKYLSTDFTDSAEAVAVRDQLIQNIDALSAGRTNLPDDYHDKKARNFDTGISLLDEMLHHMDVQAIEYGINFSVHFGTDLESFVPKDVSDADLVHTIDDLLKNAFKSTLSCEKRMVQLQFYKLGKHFVVEVADSGIPFEVNTLVNMGFEKMTTYEDGTGIGLMDIWNTKENYRATYHLEEYASATPFSKKISLTFDRKNRYSIRTWRKNEILQMCKRIDLQVYDHRE